ncbi:MAG TPA: AraC family transcriptional regulator [Acidimicrobiales bacterium]
MDSLGALLDGPRARDAFLLRATMAPPWSLRIDDHAPLSVVAVVSGSAWITAPDSAPVELGAGDVGLCRWHGPYVINHPLGTEPTVVVHPGDRCQTLDGTPLDQSMRHGVRSWGNDRDGGDVMLIGTYHDQGELSGRLLSALPPLVVIRAVEWDNPLLTVLEAELIREDLGQSAVLDRLLDLVLVTALRIWLARPETEAPGWYVAMSDPVVGDALRLLHDDPAAPWTVASLATEVGLSRAALARRFTALVGDPPMTYLTNWRLGLAADRLRQPGASVGSVAADVGYSNAFAFSTAFKRHRGVSPRAHARAARTQSTSSPSHQPFG